MYEDDIDAPVTECVLVLDVAVAGQHQIYPRMIPGAAKGISNEDTHGTQMVYQTMLRTHEGKKVP